MFFRGPPFPSDRHTYRSWFDAAATCRYVGGYLPIIRSKEELNELMTFLKLSEDMPTLIALYIGLIKNPEHKVKFWLFGSSKFTTKTKHS